MWGGGWGGGVGVGIGGGWGGGGGLEQAYLLKEHVLKYCCKTLQTCNPADVMLALFCWVQAVP